MDAPAHQRLVAALLLLPACGGDDGAAVTQIGTEDGISGSGSASASGSTAGEAACSPVNPEVAADAEQVVEVTAVDYAFEPSAVEIPAGVTTFELVNDGEPDEDALAAAGAFELEAIGVGQTCPATYELAAGEYTLFCVVGTADGVTHYELGMRGTLTVT